MSPDALIQLLPDLVLLMKRDGSVVAHAEALSRPLSAVDLEAKFFSGAAPQSHLRQTGSA